MVSWIIDDSEDEDMGLLDSIPQPPPHNTTTTSPISDFTNTLATKAPTAENTSPVSQFLTNALPQRAAVASSSNVLTSPNAPLTKRTKPKPIPAYKSAKLARAAALAASTSSIGDSISSASSASFVPTEPYTSLPVPEALAGPSNAGASSIASSSKPSLAFDGIVIPRGKSPEMAKKNAPQSDVIELSSDEDSLIRKPHLPVKSQRKAASAMFRVPEPPHAPSSSILPPSEPPSTIPSSRPPSPIFGAAHVDSTPPSSPIIPRAKKRKPIILDDDDVTRVAGVSIPVVAPTPASTTSGASVKKKKAVDGTTKEKKSRSKKSTEDGGKDNPKKTKTKSKAEEKIEYKSKEFIEDSEGEDDLLLKPSPPSANRRTDCDVSMLPPTVTTVPSSSCSEPPGPDGSVPASTSKSIPPSVSVSIAPSADFSVPSSSRAQADPAVARKPTSDRNATPIGAPEMTISKKDTVKKKKKKEETVANACDNKGSEKASSRPPDSSRSKPPSPKPTEQTSSSSKARKRAIVDSDNDDEPRPPSKKPNSPAKKKPESRDEDKENNSIYIQPLALPSPSTPTSIPATPAPPKPIPSAPVSTPTPRPRTSSTPKGNGLPPRRDSMSLLIRRASSKVHTPLGTPTPTHTHSPLAKASRAALSRIAPLHPNRREPPPAPPRPPPPKKSKKMVEMEERWEEELSESVEGWACLGEEERAGLRRAKRDAELGYED